MIMSDQELNAIVQNEIEWRKQLWKKVEKTENDLHEFKVQMTEITTTLKIKIGLAGTLFGFLGGTIVTVVVALIK